MGKLADVRLNLISSIDFVSVQIMEIIDKLLYIRSAECKISTTANYEGRAMAMIVFVLKLLFGLDGITERKLSELAAKVNK